MPVETRAMARAVRAVAFACAFVLALATLPRAAAAADAPGVVELEFWRSSDRLGTTSAYQAYLDAYPRGTFAPLARAGIEKAGAKPQIALEPSPRAGSAQAPVPAPTLKPFSEEARNTNSIPFLLGDRFVGPGAITVGWAGAKKQVLLPPGTWIALAGIDYKSDEISPYSTGNVPARVNMTSMVFARFIGERPVTLLRFTVNNQRTVVSRWSDVEGCDDRAAAATQLARSRRQTNFGETCASIRASDNWAAVLGRSADETRRNLGRLGAELPGGAVVVSVASIAETRNGFLGSTRIDFPGSGTAADWAPAAVAQNPGRGAWIRQLADWQKRYQAAANEGLTRNIDIAELTAGGATAAAAATPLVDDVDVFTSSR